MVVSSAKTLEFHPRISGPRATGIVFICGAGIAAEAYAPLLRPLAESGDVVYIVRLPLRFAPLEQHKQEVVGRVREILTQGDGPAGWVLAGHSLGAALACRVAQAAPPQLASLVLIGTTHPKRDDLSQLELPVTKVYGDRDGVAPAEDVLALEHLLPPHTEWVLIEGANHSQFGHYGHQLLDGQAIISREQQQMRTREVLREVLRGVQASADR